jgi:hypothetical protein
LYKYIPSFDLFQAPARWMIWLVFALSVMAGFGAEAWQKPGKWGRFWANLSLALGVTVTAIAILASILVPALPGVFIKAFIIFGVSIVLGCVLVKTNSRSSEKEGKHAALWQWAVVTFVAVDLLVANWGFHQGADPSLYEKATAAAKAVKAQAGSGRIYISAEDLNQLQYEEFFNFRDFRMDGKWDALANAVLPNTNLYGGLASVNNFDPLVPSLYSNLMNELGIVDEHTRLNLLRRMDVTLIEVPDGEGGKMRFDLLSGSSRFRWSSCLLIAQSDDDTLAKLIEQASEGSKPVPIVAGNPFREPQDECIQTEATINIIGDRPENLTLKVNAFVEGWLVVSDTSFGDWRAWVDDSGYDTGVRVADYLFRMIYLRPGEHIVNIVYQPRSFYFFGVGITLICIIVIVALWISEYRREKKASPISNA